MHQGPLPKLEKRDIIYLLNKNNPLINERNLKWKTKLEWHYKKVDLFVSIMKMKATYSQSVVSWSDIHQVRSQLKMVVLSVSMIQTVHINFQEIFNNKMKGQNHVKQI